VADKKCGGSNLSIREPTPSDRLLVTGSELSGGREDAGLLEGRNAIAVRHSTNAAKSHPHSHDNLIRRWLSRNRRLSGAVLLHGDTLAFAFDVSTLGQKVAPNNLPVTDHDLKVVPEFAFSERGLSPNPQHMTGQWPE